MGQIRSGHPVQIVFYNVTGSATTRRSMTTIKAAAICSVTWPLNGSKAGGDIALIDLTAFVM